MTQTRYHHITTSDLTALLDCRAALADLVHVLDSEPGEGLTSPELRGGHQAWLHTTMTNAHAALDAASTSLAGEAPARNANPYPEGGLPRSVPVAPPRAADRTAAGGEDSAGLVTRGASSGRREQGGTAFAAEYGPRLVVSREVDQ